MMHPCGLKIHGGGGMGALLGFPGRIHNNLHRLTIQAAIPENTNVPNIALLKKMSHPIIIFPETALVMKIEIEYCGM